MSTKTMSAAVLQAYLAQTPPDEEVDLSTLATQIKNKNLTNAISYFINLPEETKVTYLFYLYNYYYNLITNGNWLLELTGDNIAIQELEDMFIIPFDLDTTSVIGLRKLISILQKNVAKQRIHRKEVTDE